MVRRTLFLILAALLLPVTAAAQYKFQVPENRSAVTVNPDSSVAVEYWITFANEGQPIDIIDVGFPGPGVTGVVADLDGAPMTDIRPSEFVENGVEVHVEGKAIPAGARGTLHLTATVPARVFPDDKDPQYASLVFSPTWYGSEFTSGTTALTCTFILPEGVTTEEPRWHDTEPTAKSFEANRVHYTWEIPQASPSGQYTFGASFPRRVMTSVAEKPLPPPGPGPIGRLFEGLMQMVGGCMPCLFFLIFPTTIIWGIWKNHTRRLQYLPATVGMEGVEVRRGLTVPEVAVLMQEPVDRVMSLVLFGLIRKGCLRITGRTPLKFEVVKADAAQFSYETEFVKAVENDGKVSESEAAKVLSDLIKKVGDKMKGYSRKRSLEYYRDIMKRAWDQVGSEDYSQAFEWLLLDKEFGRTARERYGERPLPIPLWWTTVHTGGYGGGGSSPSGGGLHTGDLTSAANNIVSGIEGFGHDLVNSVPGLASKVTAATNPVPVSSGGGHSGGGCACACACAGCACACAGGGR